MRLLTAIIAANRIIIVLTVREQPELQKSVLQSKFSQASSFIPPSSAERITGCKLFCYLSCKIIIDLLCYKNLNQIHTFCFPCWTDCRCHIGHSTSLDLELNGFKTQYCGCHDRVEACVSSTRANGHVFVSVTNRDTFEAFNYQVLKSTEISGISS